MNCKYINTLNYAEIILVVLLSIIFFSCNAPHNNPLDPDNPDNILFIIEGTVISDAKDSKPLKDVLVYWQNEKKSAVTDSDGKYKINCDNLNDGWIFFEKNGYTRDSLLVLRNMQKKIQLVTRLNAVPVLDSIYFYSVVRNKFSKSDYMIAADVYISDVDDEVDSVFIQSTELGILKSLEKQTVKYFSGQFYDSELNLSSIEELIGKNFEIIAVNSNGKRSVTGKADIKRIIKEEIETIAPKNADTVTTLTPVFRWKRFIPGYSFSYIIEVYTDETEPELQYRKENILSDEISHTMAGNLQPTAENKFFWVIWCVDKFKNKSRSKPAGFILNQ